MDPRGLRVTEVATFYNIRLQEFGNVTGREAYGSPTGGMDGQK